MCQLLQNSMQYNLYENKFLSSYKYLNFLITATNIESQKSTFSNENKQLNFPLQLFISLNIIVLKYICTYAKYMC